jgi:hypothetical protein
MKLTAKAPRTPSFLYLKIAFLGDLGALAVQNHNLEEVAPC